MERELTTFDQVPHMVTRVAPVIILAVGLASGGPSGALGETGAPPEVPAEVDTTTTYVFYLHGRIVEGTDRRPVHPDFGRYEYDQVLGALGAAGRKVISEQRATNTSASVYAEKIAAQVRGLVEAGAQPERVSVVGFSKGGAIAAFVSDQLADLPVTYVLLAACAPSIVQDTDLLLTGRVLSIRESSDDLVGSCEAVAQRSGHLAGFRELVIHTGRAHGTFYRPDPTWLLPTLAWIETAGVTESPD